jgi:hypothetical protein
MIPYIGTVGDRMKVDPYGSQSFDTLLFQIRIYTQLKIRTCIKNSWKLSTITSGRCQKNNSSTETLYPPCVTEEVQFLYSPKRRDMQMT